MREIKFRAWDKCNERMVEPRNVLKINMSRLNQEPYLIVYLKKWMNPGREIKEIDKCYTNEFQLMQYTGLKDRRGVGIYEGDILKYIIEDGEGDIGVVKMSECGFWIVEIKEIDDFDPLCDWLDGEIKVLGNTCENPELLEVE